MSAQVDIIPEGFSLQTLALKLDTSPKTLQREIDDGKLASFRIRGSVRVSPAALKEYLANCPTKAAKPESTRRTR